MPPWTPQQLKAAVLALSPAPADDQAAADAINAQTVQASPADFPAAFAFNVLDASATADWFKVVQRSKQALSGSATPTAADMAVLAASAAVALMQVPGETVRASDTTTWARFTASLAALQAVGDVSAASVSAITALATPSPTAPKWVPAVTSGDVQTAKAQP